MARGKAGASIACWLTLQVGEASWLMDFSFFHRTTVSTFRINLETGKKEAKLLDPSEADNPNTHIVIATKKDDDGVDEPSSISDENVKAVREKMAKLKLSKDIEQIKFLMANFQNASSVGSKVTILDDLDYYMHQVIYYTSQKRVQLGVST